MNAWIVYNHLNRQIPLAVIIAETKAKAYLLLAKDEQQKDKTRTITTSDVKYVYWLERFKIIKEE